jgi:uncharacterized protein
VNESGQPYIQFRGGPPGFLKVVDTTTPAYADFRGNLQYISVGNLAATPLFFSKQYFHREDNSDPP